MTKFIAVTIEEVHRNTYIMPAVLDDGAIVGIDNENVSKLGIPVDGYFEFSRLGEIVHLEYGPFDNADFAAVASDYEEGIHQQREWSETND